VEAKIIEAQGNVLRFYIRGIETQIANAIRRIIMAEVPTMAIEDVIVVENTSAVHDEILAHRLGLIPLKSDLDTYSLREFCGCNSELGCGKCSVSFTLEAEAHETTRIVYSKELKSSDPKIAPVSGDIQIVKLAPGQRIRLEAYARLGKGAEHAKWQPVSVSSYKYSTVIIFDPKKCNICERCVKACPKHVIRAEADKIVVADYEACDLCSRCVEECPSNAIEVRQEEGAFIFIVESTGALPTERIVIEAIRILEKKAEDFAEQVLRIGEADE
jgi:DNA-directed RNA polymerase subunit D